MTIRSTEPELFTWVRAPETTAPPPEEEEEPSLSVVTGRASGRTRRLPTLYLGRAPVFADRSLAKVAERVDRSLEAIERAYSKPVYALQACEIGELKGLYARDLFNRSAYRRRLVRAGARFADDPYVTLHDDGSWNCGDWGDFRPSFVVLTDEDDDEGVFATGRGLLAFTLALFRFGMMGRDELTTLTSRLGDVRTVASKDPAALITALS